LNLLKNNKIFFASFLILISININANYFTNNYTIKIKNLDKNLKNNKKRYFLISSKDKNFSLKNSINQKIISSQIKSNKKKIIISTKKNYREIRKKRNLFQYKKKTFLLYLTKKEKIFIFQKIKKGNLVNSTKLFVNKFIKDKIIGIPIISAHEIFKLRKGDCTEHTILTIAILRTLKIPARATVGLKLTKHFFKSKNVFVYHMWAEAFYRGKWQIVDATTKSAPNYSHYIKLGEHNLKTEMPLNLLIILSHLNGIRISEIKHKN